MNGHERMQALFSRLPTDRIPHFEMVFQIPEEAFGRSWPTYEQMHAATDKERERYKEDFFSLWDLILDTYHWDAVHIPLDLHGYFRGSLLREGRDRFKGRAMVYDYNGNGTFWMPLGGEAMLDFTIKLYEEPEELHREAEQKLRDSIELAREQVGSGAEFIIINSDYAFNKGPFISPDRFDEVVIPYLARNVQAIHDLGVKAILHSDGDLRLILDHLVETGIDGYQSIDPQANMDIREVKRRYGDRLILMGNVMTSMLQDGTDEEIRASVRYCCESAKPGGGYIFSTSNCLFKGMPLRSYHIMLDEFEKYAQY